MTEAEPRAGGWRRQLLGGLRQNLFLLCRLQGCNSVVVAKPELFATSGKFNVLLKPTA